MFTTSYSTIIAKGLGAGPQALIIAKYTLTYGIDVEVIEPPVPPTGGSGGGWARHPVVNIPGVPKGSPYYMPAPRQYGKDQRFVVIKVTLKQRTWSKTFLVEKDTAGIIVKVIGLLQHTELKINAIFNSVKTKVSNISSPINNIKVQISKLSVNAKHLKRKVTALFKQDDK